MIPSPNSNFQSTGPISGFLHARFLDMGMTCMTDSKIGVGLKHIRAGQNFFVPEEKLHNNLLFEMRRKRAHFIAGVVISKKSIKLVLL